jgi:hypothetical protein
LPDDNGLFQLVPESLEAEARKWRRLSDDMSRVQADLGRLRLYPTAFFFADVVSVTGHSMAYDGFHEWMSGLAGEAASEFTQIGSALDRSAELYAGSDQKSAGDLARIYGTRER